jgi:hypothetical protein
MRVSLGYCGTNLLVSGPSLESIQKRANDGSQNEVYGYQQSDSE